MKYDNIINYINSTPWVITEDGLQTILSIMDRKINGEEFSMEQLAELKEQNEERSRVQLPESPGIAVLPIQGSIFPKANLLTEFSGGTSIEKLMSDFNMLMGEDNVKGILLNIDSPGGNAVMIQEMADVIYEARQSGEKPIWAIANASAASGAYYLGTQAEKLYMTPSGTVGSIGVITVHTDESGADAKEGIKRTVLTVGENKGLGNPTEPLSDKAKQIKIEEMTEIYNDFVSSVARGRGVAAEHVEEHYGKGRVYKSRSALEKGMVDGVKTINAVSTNFLDHVFKSSSTRRVNVPPKQGVKAMAEITPETLEVLGLSEDATSEDVLNAVTALSDAADIIAPPVEDQVITPDFAKQFPEQARLMAELQLGRRQDAAKLFAQGYERFSTDNGETGFGFSGLALTQVEEFHLKIADGVVTHDDLRNLLDCVATGNAVVDYRELGSKRGKEHDVPVNAMDAATKLKNMADKLVAEDESVISYGDALSKVMDDPENADLVAAYRRATKPVINSGGDE